jgi:predicted nucleic acid-binding protein
MASGPNGERSSHAQQPTASAVYADHPRDLADASLVVAAESLGTRKIFTVDRKDFTAYRVRRGHRHYPFEVLP